MAIDRPKAAYYIPVQRPGSDHGWATRHGGCRGRWILAEALGDALARPEIFNTDQGSQFTSLDHRVLKNASIRISMTVGAAAWTTSSSSGRSLKYEAVAWLTDGFHAERVIGAGWRSASPKTRPGAGQPVDMMSSHLAHIPTGSQQQQDVIKRILAA